MIPSQFEYVAPTTVEEAIQALAEGGEDAKVLAGGQSLLPVLRMRLNAPSLVVDLGRIESLRGIRDDGDAIVVGATTTHSDVYHDPLVREHVRATEPLGGAPEQWGGGGERLSELTDRIHH